MSTIKFELKAIISKSIALSALAINYVNLNNSKKGIEKDLKVLKKAIIGKVALNTKTTTAGKNVITFSETITRDFSIDAKLALFERLGAAKFLSVVKVTLADLKTHLSDTEITVLADMIDYGERLAVK